MKQINVNIRMWARIFSRLLHIFFSLFSKGEKFRSLLLVRSTANQRHFRGGNFNTRLTRPLIIAPPLPPTLHSAQWGAAQPNPSHSDKLDQIRFYVTNFARFGSSDQFVMIILYF